MTHEYKVGDKGKTRGGLDYEITAVGHENVLATVSNVGLLRHETVFDMEGTSQSKTVEFNLIPPKRRIKGWLNIYAGGSFSRMAETREQADKNGLANPQRMACIEIDIEEGEGL